MAGDIGIREQVIVLPTQFGAAASATAESAREEGARIIHRYGPRVTIGEVAPERTEQAGAAIFGAEATASAGALAATTADLDPIGALGLAAFNLRQSPEYIAAKARRPYKDRPWDAGELLPPDPPQEHLHLMRPPDAGALSLDAQAVFGGTSQRMTGSIAVGLIIVSGPTADLQFSAAETQKVIAEVQNGLGWQAAQNAGANITWVYDIHTLTVDAVPGSSPDLEGLWRNPAMVQLGFTGDWQGVVDYVEQIRTTYGTDWTFAAYFTKYPLSWFAYANIGGPRLVMQYANDGWGPDNIDRVFAHETGHIFQAPDEYSSSGCNCGGSWGIYDEPNGNCQNCAPGGGVECIMRSNSWAYCRWTPLHYGFPLGPARALGSITVDGGRPYCFVQNIDTRVWVNWWSGSGWGWADQGKPAGVDITGSAGSITVDGGRPYCFVRGNDGNLWVNWWSGSAWNWANQGRPPGLSISESMGAITVDGGRPYVFVTANDGNLWVNWWSGSAWGWANQGRPGGVSIVAAMGSIIVDGGRPYCFVKGSDGNLWVNWWSGSAWGWANQGRPSGVDIASSLGSITVDGGRPYCFIKGSDGNVWVNWWSGSAWGWANQGRPGGVSIVAAMGSITVDGGRPYCFVKGTDGNLWVNWWSGSGWGWANQGRPSGVDIVGSLGSITVDGGRPYCFIKGSDGNVWVNWWSGSAWGWANQGRP